MAAELDAGMANHLQGMLSRLASVVALT